MAVALKNAKVGAPRSDRIAVLISQNSRELVEVGEVMDRPGSEQLR